MFNRLVHVFMETSKEEELNLTWCHFDDGKSFCDMDIFDFIFFFCDLDIFNFFLFSKQEAMDWRLTLSNSIMVPIVFYHRFYLSCAEKLWESRVSTRNQSETSKVSRNWQNSEVHRIMRNICFLPVNVFNVYFLRWSYIIIDFCVLSSFCTLCIFVV